MAGIGLQQFIILIFTGIATRFFIVMRKHERTHGLDGRPRNWGLILTTLYISLALISGRIIFRLVEYSSLAKTNPLPSHEVYELTLDALPMFLVIALMNVFHPGRTLQGPGSEFPSKAQRKTEKIELTQNLQKQRYNQPGYERLQESNVWVRELDTTISRRQKSGWSWNYEL